MISKGFIERLREAVRAEALATVRDNEEDEEWYYGVAHQERAEAELKWEGLIRDFAQEESDDD